MCVHFVCVITLCRRVVYPWLSDVIAVSPTGVVVSGIVHGVLSLTVSSTTQLCLVAVTADGTSSFVDPLGVYFGPTKLPLSVNTSVSNVTHVCGSLPSVAAMCGNDSTCMARGVVACDRPVQVSIVTWLVRCRTVLRFEWLSRLCVGDGGLQAQP